MLKLKLKLKMKKKQQKDTKISVQIQDEKTKDTSTLIGCKTTELCGKGKHAQMERIIKGIKKLEISCHIQKKQLMLKA